MNAGGLGRLMLAALCLWLVLASAGTPANAAEAPDAFDVAWAEARLEPDGLPTQQRRVQLPFRWDHEFPGRGGKATYRVELPASAVPAGQPAALLLSGAGSQVAISFNDALVASYGTLGVPDYDASKSNLLVPVPAVLLQQDQPKTLVVRTTIQRQRGAGLASIHYGPEASLAAVYRTRQNWRNTSAIVYAVSLLLMGGIAGGLWLRQRDALYGCFALAALSGVARNLDRVWPDVAIPWPLWGAIVAVCYACHIGLIARFVLLVLERNPPWLVRSIYTALALSVTLACASFAFAQPLLWTAGLVILQLTSIVCLPYVVYGALVDRRRIAGVLMAAGTLAILAGAHDLLLVRMGLFGGAHYTLTAHAMFFFVMILAGLVVERYSRTVADYRSLNANLAARVAEREDQLRSAFDTMRQQQQEQAVLLERQRIMREIHDGVGSQLVGLLNVVTQARPDRSVIEEHVKLALDE
ncbi:histidine kinase, partial [uncultured Variovorax sp.]|uniref:histidine kinase n=1 Tax=uncultured Variovorax sp. TaxID=114708 RepID=UPI0025E1BD61